MEYPPLVDLVKGKWPDDVIARAQQLQTEIGSVGAYSHSKGIPLIRKHVAQFIEGRSLAAHLSLTDSLSPKSAMVTQVTRKTSSSRLARLQALRSS